MSDSPRPVPSYRRHKSSGQAVVTLPDGLGRRRDVMLGRYGTKASREEYARVIAEWEARGRRFETSRAGTDLSVNELLVAFLHHADKHYRRPDGSQTTEVKNFKLAFKPLKALYGHSRAATFGPLALKAVRQQMVDSNLCRGVVNARVGRIKRVFKWAVSEELVSHSVYSAVGTVAGLSKGRTTAREADPVTPVPPAFVDAVLPHVLPPVRAMIELQRLTGMRPGEVCTMRACDIDMTGRVWTYRPSQHKTAWRGKPRVVCLGPKAQAVVREFLTMDTQAPLFSPALALANRAIVMRANRKTKVQPSQQNRRKRRPRKQPGFIYQRESYTRAIATGCDKADRARRQQAENQAAEVEGREPAKVPAEVETAQRLVPRWHPNQLRHNFGTDVRRGFGLEAAQVVLGHSRADVTQVYAERDLTLAEKVAIEVG